MYVSKRSPRYTLFRLPLTIFLIALLLPVTACDSTETASSEADLSVSFTTGTTAAPMKRILTDADGNQLEFVRVEMILEEVEFERAGSDDACRFDDDDEGSDDDCEEVERGPFAIVLPLDGPSPLTAFTAPLPIGTWSEVEFEIEPLDDDDAPPLTTNVPEDESIYVEGIWTPAGGSAVDFTWVGDVDSEQEIDFDPPIDVAAADDVNVTFLVSIDDWFRMSDGRLIDPRSANDDDLEDLVEDNIERSIEGYRDDDRDGYDDDDDDDDRDDEDDDDDRDDDDGDDDDDDDDDD